MNEIFMLKILYLRTLYAMNLKAGGSVGHTAGVINAMFNCVDVDVYSNDELADVKCNINVIRPFARKYLPQNIKELLLNIQFINKLDMQTIRPDVIYQRHTAVSFVGAYLAKKYRLPFVLEFNSSEVWKMKNWKISEKLYKRVMREIYNRIFQSRFIAAVEKYNLKNAAVIVVVSDVLKNGLIARGVSAERILVAPNGVDIEKFRPNVGGDETRKKFFLQNKKVVGFIGTFGQWHGVEVLARAIVQFYAIHADMAEDVRFLLIGDGVLIENVKAVLREGNCLDKVIMPGLIRQQDAPKYLDACDIFVSPHIPNKDGTEFFGSPTKLFEYMAMEKGIVASALGQIADVLKDGVTARLVQPGNISDLEEGIYELITNEELAKQLGKNARREVAEHYTWEQHVKKFLERLEN